MRDRLQVNPKQMPYRVGVALGARAYELEFHKNSVSKRVCVSLFLGDQCLCAGEPLVLGRVLFENCFLAQLFPPLRFRVEDESQSAAAANYENIDETVFLYLLDEEL